MRRAFGLILIIIGTALPFIYIAQAISRPIDPTPTKIVERLVPTVAQKTPAPPAPTAMPVIAPSATQAATARPTSTATATRPMSTPSGTSTPRAARTASAIDPSPTATPFAGPRSPIGALYSTRQRFGVGVPPSQIPLGNLQRIGVGWYLNWKTSAKPYQPASIEFVQMVRVPQGKIRPNLTTIADTARRVPGSLWLIGNEMDVIWQDNATPEQYVAAYHDIYATLKAADPSSRVAIGGVSQPTPLRMQYLDRVLKAYRTRYGAEMPIDVWNVHGFVLQEKRGDWGVDIPPGIDVDSGQLYTIDDHDSLTIFKKQIIDFRRWMAERGYRDRELVVSEYGILLYADFGFDTARVSKFMRGSFDFLLTATDGSLGMPADNHHLVQRWCWYSLSDSTYPTGNLVDLETKQVNQLGLDFRAYIQEH